MLMTRLALPILLVFALLGAPFGMGRMMDIPGHHAMADASHHLMRNAGAPVHEPSAPHYMVCAAFSAACPEAFAETEVMISTETMWPAAAAFMDGRQLLPPLPPPRAVL